MSGIPGTNGKATRREWIGLAVLALPCLLYSMDLNVLNLAVPHLTADLAPSATQLLWIVDIYGFLVAGCLIAMGSLGDRIGRRRLLLIGAAAFGVASAFAAFAGSSEMLIAARAVLGVSAATLAPSTLSLIRHMFRDPHERRLAIGVWVASFSGGGALGPLFGGLLLEHFWWGAVFLLNVPVMLLLLLLGPLLLPESRDPGAGRPDLASVALSLVSVLAVVYGIKHIAAAGFGWPPLLWLAAGLAVGALFVRRQAVLADPLVDLGLLRSRGLRAALLINVLTVFVAFGALLFIAQYLQLVLGLGPLEAGLWTMPAGVAFAMGSIATPRLVRWMAPARVIAGGFGLTALGFAVVALAGDTGLAAVMSGMLVFCLGLAPIGAITTDLIVGLAPPERVGAASAISETSFELGGALGIAVLGSVVTAVYRGAMAAVESNGIPAGAALAARDTLGAAVAAAERLPAAQGAELLALARAAFTHALQLASALSAGIALLAALIALVLLRRLTLNTGMHSDTDAGSA